MAISKKKDESYQQWRDRTINKISPSFCGAKWYNATIWLNSGSTASCHHPPAHKIPVEEVLANPKAIKKWCVSKCLTEKDQRSVITVGR